MITSKKLAPLIISIAFLGFAPSANAELLSPRAKLLGGITLGLAGGIGAYYTYTEAKKCAQKIEELKKLDVDIAKEEIEKLEKKEKILKAITWVSGGTTLFGTGLAIWGGMTMSNNGNNFPIEKRVYLDKENYPSFQVVLHKDGSYTLYEDEEDQEGETISAENIKNTLDREMESFKKLSQEEKNKRKEIKEKKRKEMEKRLDLTKLTMEANRVYLNTLLKGRKPTTHKDRLLLYLDLGGNAE